jgi:uncharacterized repeat protein (TIGR01451 family)
VLSILKTSAPQPGVVGSPLTFTITVTNQGPGVATNVLVMDPLPTTILTFVSATATVGSCTYTSGLVTCALGTLQNQGVEVVTIVTIPRMAGVVSNTSVVNSTDADEEGSTDTGPVVMPTPIMAPVMPSASDPWGAALVVAVLAVLVISLRRLPPVS